VHRLGWLVLLGVAAVAGWAGPGDYYRIQVVDAQTGRGVPLVQLRTANRVAWWTDSRGLIAFFEPGLMGVEVGFEVHSPGYELLADRPGEPRVRLKPVAGGSASIRLERRNVAERLYRITGQGIYRDSLLLGEPVPLREPVFNGQVMGQDTVIATPYRGRIYWFWGDTIHPASVLESNFAAAGATSALAGQGGLDPAVGVDFEYFVGKKGFSMAMCPRPEGGLKWIESLFTVIDAGGRERLAARVARVPGLAPALDWHLMLFNDDTGVFEPVKTWRCDSDHRSTHPFRAEINGTHFYYVAPDYRVRADLESLGDLNTYEAFTCVLGSGLGRIKNPVIDRDAAGHPRYAWRAGVGRPDVDALVRQRALRAEESWAHKLDYRTGEPVAGAPYSMAWNAYRRRWIGFFTPRPGAVWFAEADTPLGPWGYGLPIATHGDYNFYNVAHHPFFDQDGGRLVYFEGTYTAAFTAADAQGRHTPRYDYNQIMYRLALDDPRLVLPVAVYPLAASDGTVDLLSRDAVDATAAWERVGRVVFFALPPTARGEGLVPVYCAPDGRLSTNAPTPDAAVRFVGRPLVEAADRPASALVVLREYRNRTGSGWTASTAGEPPPDGLPDGRAICRVWRVPGAVFTLDREARPVSAERR
jgi:hypothetical protein